MTVDSSGLTIQTLAEIRASMRASARASLGAGVSVGADSLLGQIIDLVADVAATAYEALQGVYDAFNPAASRGVNLESLSSINGVYREPARASTSVLELTGTPATFIPLGTIIRVGGGPRFLTASSAVIGGFGTVDVLSQAESTGPVEALAGTITEIVTPIAGLASATNPADAVLGRNVETDDELRVRRASALQPDGEATDPAIRAALLALAIVDQCVVISNREDVTDAYGIPPHGFRAIVWPDPGVYPADVDIFETIALKQPAGIRPDGARVASVTDSQGTAQLVRYSVASELSAVLSVTVDTTTAYPVDGDAQVTDAIIRAIAIAGGANAEQAQAAVDAGEASLNIGAGLYRITSICAAAGVAGVVGVAVLQAISPGFPAAADLVADLDEIITVAAGDITVFS